jgi:hypothetical protein
MSGRIQYASGALIPNASVNLRVADHNETPLTDVAISDMVV